MRDVLLATGMAALSTLSWAAETTRGRAHEAAFDRFKEAIVTVEVLPLTGEARSVLGSGYLVASGRIVTNYHVVGSYIRHPDRYGLRLKNLRGILPARLVAFDLINDLALLEAPLRADPLELAPATGRPGASLIAFGNPEGLGLSLVEGVFNGFAEKGFVDRMLLSMPINSGMSGGPILDDRDQVVGTNVSVAWRSNSLSFGVPVSAVHALLRAPAVQTTPSALFAEVNRQLGLLDGSLARAVQPLTDAGAPLMAVGGAQVPRPPEAFECWNQARQEGRDEVFKTSFQCNLQFTPSLEEVGEVSSIELLMEHFASRRSRYGFYGGLAQHAPEHLGLEPRAPGNGVLSAPECHADRVRTKHLVWKVNLCSYAYVRHPGVGYFVLTATSVSRPAEAVYVALHGRGVGAKIFLALGRTLLEEIRFGGRPS
ncbi:MAG TPA: serine protease [Vicinamibacteria bacterium]